MATRPKPSLAHDAASTQMLEALESLRRGTLQEFLSEWLQLDPGQSASRRHGLGEDVPATVSVDLDDVGDGRNAIRATQQDVTVESNVEEVTITNDSETRQFFRIRAR